MWNRLRAQEEARLGRPLTDDEFAQAMQARLACKGGLKTQKRAMRKAIRHGI